MKNLQKLNRENLKQINGGGNCNDSCPDASYGPGFERSCDDFESLPACCKGRVIVSHECFPR